MTSFEHDGSHVWTGESPRTVRCALMFCRAKPTTADIERVRVDIAARRATRREIDFSQPGRR